MFKKNLIVTVIKKFNHLNLFVNLEKKEKIVKGQNSEILVRFFVRIKLQ